MVRFIRALCTILVATLVGCAQYTTKVGHDFVEAPSPNPGFALLYMYRPFSSFGYMQAPSIFVDGKKVVNLVSEGYTWFHVPAGHIEVEARWDILSGMPPSHLAAVLESEKVYYLELYTSKGVPVMQANAFYTGQGMFVSYSKGNPNAKHTFSLFEGENTHIRRYGFIEPADGMHQIAGGTAHNNTLQPTQ